MAAVSEQLQGLDADDRLVAGFTSFLVLPLVQLQFAGDADETALFQ
jgi:hypothetical protein